MDANGKDRSNRSSATHVFSCFYMNWNQLGGCLEAGWPGMGFSHVSGVNWKNWSFLIYTFIPLHMISHPLSLFTWYLILKEASPVVHKVGLFQENECTSFKPS